MTDQEKPFLEEETTPDRNFGKTARTVLRAATVILLILGTNQAFNFSAGLGYTLIEQQYLYMVLLLSVPLVFLLFPPHAKKGNQKPTRIDWALVGIVIFFSLYSLLADQMPGPISAVASPFKYVAAYHAMSLESMMGIPLRAFANLVFGFVIFGAALDHTGAGRFFINFAFALLGHMRGRGGQGCHRVQWSDGVIVG